MATSLLAAHDAVTDPLRRMTVLACLGELLFHLDEEEGALCDRLAVMMAGVLGDRCRIDLVAGGALEIAAWAPGTEVPTLEPAFLADARVKPQRAVGAFAAPLGDFGVLSISTEPARLLSEEESHLLVEVAARAAAALSAARRRREALDDKRRGDLAAQVALRLRGLADASIAIATAVPTGRVLAVAAERARDLLGTSFAEVVAERDDQTVRARSVDAAPGGFASDDVLLAALVALGRDATEPLRMTAGELARVVPDARLPHGWMAAPMRDRSGAPSGVLHVAGRHGGAFTADDEAILVQLANLVATALENERLQRETRAAVARRDDFLATASHELRSPLTTLYLQLEALVRHGELIGHDEKTRARVRGLGEQIERLTTLVDTLLDVSRFQSGALAPRLERVDLAAVARDVTARLADQIVWAGCDLVVRAADPVVGEWDAIWIERIVTNLVTNAMKYGHGKPIEVIVDGGDLARVTVRDHGIGIAPEDQARIFERFERATPRGSRYAGLGLGLFITRQIVASLGGTIRVASSPGAGATFTVELPRRST